MNAKTRMNEGTAEFMPLLEISLGLEMFTSRWAHCDKIATYVARLVSHNRADSLLYSNLFSSALNELLETAFRSHSGSGELSCSVWRAGNVDRIDLTIPCDEAIRGFYASAVEETRQGHVSERYVQALLNEREVDPRLGLFELAVDYKAKLSLESAAANAVCLSAYLALEDAA